MNRIPLKDVSCKVYQHNNMLGRLPFAGYSDMLFWMMYAQVEKRYLSIGVLEL